MTAETASRRRLDRLLRPRSVAVVGASDKPGALGASVLANLRRAGFAGAIYPINPNRASIDGLRCLGRIEDLPPAVDVAVLAIPRSGVVDAVRALAAQGVGGAVIFSAGFAETGAEGVAEQRAIARIAEASGMIVEGPNCLGLVNFVGGVPLTFVEMPHRPLGRAPGLAIVSQSGAMAAVLGVSLLSRDLGLSYSISTGNEAASGVEDFIDWLADDAHTRVIAMIVEQFRHPRRFLAAAARAIAAGKAIVLLHPGRSSAARASAATHTGALAGDFELMRTHVARAGVVLVETLEELGDVAEVALRCPALPAAGGTAVLGESGAFKALALDLADTLGLDLPPLDDASAPMLRAAMPPFVAVSNPVDLTAQGLVEPALYTRTIEALLADDRFAATVIGVIQTDARTCAIKFPAILAALPADRRARPVLLAGLDEGAPGAEDFVPELRARGVPYFRSPERALRAVARLIADRDRDRSAVVDPPLVLAGANGLSGIVPEFRAKALLAPLGIPFPPGRLAATIDQAGGVADALGYPVALKAQSAALSHKSEAGGVLLGLADRAAVADGWRRLHANLARFDPALALDGVLVERMGSRGLEMIVGGRNDLDWGPVILIGFGGVQAEAIRDVRLIAHDLPRNGVIAELRRLKGAALLDGFRGAPPVDLPALADLVVTLGRLLAGEPRIREIDLNPVVVHRAGEGVVALDALMLLDEAG